MTALRMSSRDSLEMFQQEGGKDESDVAQKLAALQTKTSLNDEALLEASASQGSENYVSRFIPRTVAGPSFMDRKLQQLKVCSKCYGKGLQSLLNFSIPLKGESHI